jgi:hypothetical protein
MVRPGGTAILAQLLDSNPIWAELNKRVGAKLNITIISFAGYGATKLPTVLAGADLP